MAKKGDCQKWPPFSCQLVEKKVPFNLHGPNSLV
jgi:hypothetical protein